MKIRKCMVLVLLIVLLSGCAYPGDGAYSGAGTQTQDTEETSGTGFVAAAAGSYDSVDTAIVVKKDMDVKTISLRNLETGRQYTLSYGGTSVLSDQNAQAMSMEQVAIGDLVDVTFLKSKKTLTTLQESVSAFILKNVTDFTVSESGRSMTIAGITYRLCDDLAVVSGTQLVSLTDLNEYDTLIVRGYENDVHSIVVDKGHGYLRLENDESFIGGFIEVGSIAVVPITENMMLTVPEGSYDVTVSCGGSYGTKEVVILRDEEQTMDVGDLVAEIKEGGILFDITPASADVYVDAEKVDTSEAVTLTYGIHQLIIRADGYTTLTKYLKVGQELATLSIEMETDTSAAETDEETASENTDTADETDAAESDSEAETATEDDNNTATENSAPTGEGSTTNGEGSTTTGKDSSTASGVTDAAAEQNTVTASDGSSYYVNIDMPEKAEVYVDGTYVGITPVKFKKVEGSHIISLRRTGYQTRSYTIDVDAELKDVTYSFSELTAIAGN